MSLKVKFGLFVGALIVIIMSLVAWITLQQVKKPLVNEMVKKGQALVANLASNSTENLLTGDELLLGVSLDRLMQEKSILYAMVLNSEGEVISHSDHTVAKNKKFTDPLTLQALSADSLLVQPFKNLDGESGYDISMPMVVKTKKIGLVRIGFSDHEIKLAVAHVAQLILYITLIALVLGILSSSLLVRWLLNPLKNLSAGVSFLATGNFEHKIDISSKDELGELAYAFNDMTGRLKQAQLEQIEKEKFKKELQIAHEIQDFLLPKTIPDLPGFELRSYYSPAKEIGGDYFDYFQLNDRLLGIVVADVSGKGIPGSLGMVMTRSLLRSQVQGNPSPSRVLSQTNVLFRENMKKGMFVTMFYAILDLETRVLRCANAGHLPLLVARSSTRQVEVIPSNGVALGIAAGSKFEQYLKDQTVMLETGDIVVIYTDGVNEATNSSGEQFGIERINSCLLESLKLPAGDVVNKICQRVTEFSGIVEPADDITLLALKKQDK